MPSKPPALPSARLFVALWPDAAVRAALPRLQAAWQWPPGAVLTPPERLHVTLHFIGEVAQDSVLSLSAALERIRFEPFDLALDAPQLWTGGVAVLRASRVPAPLARLERAVTRGVADVLGPAAGHPRFQPHATLARRADAAAVPAAAIVLTWPAERVALVESMRGAAAGYRVLREVRSTGRRIPP